MANRNGLVIAIDGPDGVGKTTQVSKLTEYLEKTGRKVHQTRSSGGTPIGEALRQVSLSANQRPPETDLYISLAMGEALAIDIAERKHSGQIIIIDRSPLAVIAYNGFGSQLKDRGLAFDACERLFKKWQIDLLLFLTAPDRTIQTRREKRGTKDYFENQNRDYHARVKEGYEKALEFLQSHSQLGAKVVTVDATQEIESVHRAILKAVKII